MNETSNKIQETVPAALKVAQIAEALEKMIAKGGDKIEREYALEDKENGVGYKGRFTLERVRSTELEG